jgi:hypothetical protein
MDGPFQTERNREQHAVCRLLPATMGERLDFTTTMRRTTTLRLRAAQKDRVGLVLSTTHSAARNESSTPIPGSFRRPCGVGSTRLHASGRNVPSDGDGRVQDSRHLTDFCFAKYSSTGKSSTFCSRASCVDPFSRTHGSGESCCGIWLARPARMLLND